MSAFDAQAALGRVAWAAAQLPGAPKATEIALAAADASARIYARVTLASPLQGSPFGRGTVVAMLVDPAEFLRVDEATGTAAPPDMPFLLLADWLGGLGLPLPRPLVVDRERGVVLLDDLGDETLFVHVSPLLGEHPEVLPPDALRRPALLLAYERAIRQLVAMQRAVWPTAGDPHGLITQRRFSTELLEWELWHFVRWMVEEEGRAELSPAQGAMVRRRFHDLAQSLTQAPQRPVHRDYQSRNLMVVPRAPGAPEGLAIIDFQDMLTGPLVYDLASLLRDSYVALSVAEIEALVAYWTATARTAGILPLDFSDADLRALFFRQVLQRKLKDAGRFVFIRERRGNPSFMRFVPRTLAYLKAAFAALPEYADLFEALAPHVPAWRS